MVIVLFIMVFLKLGFEGLTRMQICFAMARKIRCARSNARLLGLFLAEGYRNKIIRTELIPSSYQLR